jgi:hypothetical protein
MNMKTLKMTAPQDLHAPGGESHPQGNGFQPDSQIMRALSTEPSSIQLDDGNSESKIQEPDKKEQGVAAVPSANEIPEEVAYHERALVYLEELGEKIKAEYGQEKLDGYDLVLMCNM